MVVFIFLIIRLYNCKDSFNIKMKKFILYFKILCKYIVLFLYINVEIDILIVIIIKFLFYLKSYIILYKNSIYFIGMLIKCFKK